jgi:hypothetical protein
MEVKGNTIILDVGEEITIKARNEQTPEPSPEPSPDRMTLADFLARFNPVLTSRWYNPVTESTEVRKYLGWACGLA